MAKKILLFSAFILLSACSSKNTNSKNNNHKCSGSFKIFSLIVNHVQKDGYRNLFKTTPLIIADSTQTIYELSISFSIDSASISFVRKKLTKLKSSTVEDFLNSNLNKISLANKIQLKQKQIFASQVVSGHLFLILSNIGFGENCNQALIAYHYTCGPKCGYERFIVLRKQNKQWKITKSLQTAVN